MRCLLFSVAVVASVVLLATSVASYGIPPSRSLHNHNHRQQQQHQQHNHQHHHHQQQEEEQHHHHHQHLNELGSHEVEAEEAVVMDEATDPGQPDRLLAIYNYIKQLVHGVTGGEEPDHGQMYNRIKDHMEETYAVQGPSGDAGDLDDEAASERLCETRSQWVLLNRTVNTDGDSVEIVHDVYKQWYHYTECVNADRPCSAVSESAFESHCVQTEGFQLMYARSLTTADVVRPSFMFVAVPRDCVCKAAPRKKAISKRI